MTKTAELLRTLRNAALRLHPRLRSFAWNSGYEHAAAAGSVLGEMPFFNYGYESLDESQPELALDSANEANRRSIQLYHRVTSGADLKGKQVLEVGCGRGGGASYVMNCFGPERLVGLDLARNNVRRCRERPPIAGLSFRQGDAEHLPFPDEDFDAVLNVESSHGYPSRTRFLQEVARVLRASGAFLFADFVYRRERGNLSWALTDCGLRVTEEEDITENVLEARRRATPEFRAFVQTEPRRSRERLCEWAGLVGTRTFESMRSGELRYLRITALRERRP